MSHYWLEKHLSGWHEAVAADRKPQAVIINGSEGMGKRALLQQIIADLLCRQSTPACGQCQNCRLHQQGYHPDVDLLLPENNLIKVKMVRELTNFFVSTPHCSDHKLAVIEGAHLMNTAAANALLKLLEEPPSRGLLFLLTDSKHKLMPTIKSRCITLDVVLNREEKQRLPKWVNSQNRYSDDQVRHALILADWVPLTAQKLLEEGEEGLLIEQLDNIFAALTAQKSVSEIAANLAAIDNTSIWAMLNRYMNALAKSILHAEKAHSTINHALNQLVKKKPKVLHLIIKFADQINLVMLNSNTQVKKQLLIESMLIDLKATVAY